MKFTPLVFDHPYSNLSKASNPLARLQKDARKNSIGRPFTNFSQDISDFVQIQK
jgi:hypothetical protein